jgi:hypothetical protein
MVELYYRTKHGLRELRRHWKLILVSGFIGYYAGGGCNKPPTDKLSTNQQDIMYVAQYIENKKQQEFYQKKVLIDRLEKSLENNYWEV